MPYGSKMVGARTKISYTYTRENVVWDPNGFRLKKQVHSEIIQPQGLQEDHKVWCYMPNVPVSDHTAP